MSIGVCALKACMGLLSDIKKGRVAVPTGQGVSCDDLADYLLTDTSACHATSSTPTSTTEAGGRDAFQGRHKDRGLLARGLAEVLCRGRDRLHLTDLVLFLSNASSNL